MLDKENIFMKINRISKLVSLCLCGLLLLAVTVGCSDQILLESGEIVTKGQSLATQAPTGTEAEAQTSGGVVTTPPLTVINPGSSEGQTTAATESVPSLSIGTQAATIPSISIGEDPEDIFKDSESMMRVDFLNTGESDCILLRINDKVVLVDTADGDDSQKIKRKLQEYGITSIDCLILTHYDNDHIGSVAALLSDFAVNEVYMPDYVRSSGLYRSAMSAINDCVDASRIHRLYGETVELTIGGASISLNATALYERGMTLGADGSTEGVVENNFSLMTTVTLGSARILLAGDAENDRMAEFASQLDSGYPSYMLVKTPHHGEYTKALGVCLSQSRPRYCVVCTDTKEKVEPKLETEMIGSAAYYTFNGDVCFVTDGSVARYLIKQEK